MRLSLFRHRVSRIPACWLCDRDIDSRERPKLCGRCGEIVAATAAAEGYWPLPERCPGRPYVRRFTWKSVRSDTRSGGGLDQGRDLP